MNTCSCILRVHYLTHLVLEVSVNLIYSFNRLKAFGALIVWTDYDPWLRHYDKELFLLCIQDLVILISSSSEINPQQLSWTCRLLNWGLGNISSIKQQYRNSSETCVQTCIWQAGLMHDPSKQYLRLAEYLSSLTWCNKTFIKWSHLTLMSTCSNDIL